jgi:hypothetical protein
MGALRITSKEENQFLIEGGRRLVIELFNE